MPKNILGRFFLISGFIIFALLLSWEVFGADMNIIEVRRNIPLADDAPIYKDFYINAGTSNQLKKNMVVTVTRKLAIKDNTGTESFGELEVPVGQIKIIAVHGRIAVGREFKLTSRENEAMLEQIGMMVGDQLTSEGSFIDNKKPSDKKSE